MLVHVNGRPSMIIRWEELHVGVQVAVAFVASFTVLTFVHWAFLNQPGGRSLSYGLFWGVIATAVIMIATRTERGRRHRADQQREGPPRG